MTHDRFLLLLAAATIAGLIIAIARFKLQAFIALTAASLFLGLCSGKDPVQMARSFGDGVGAVLGSTAMIIALGAVLGKTMAVSGGAECIATTLIGSLSPRRTHWTLALVAFVVGIPVFFSVGLVLLLPIVFTMARDARVSFLLLALPLVAALSVAHGLVPPHPGPLAAVALLQADMGKTIFFSLIVSLPVVVVCGPILGGLLARREQVEPGGILAQISGGPTRSSTPRFTLALFTVLLPVILMLGATATDLCLSSGNRIRHWADWLGQPVVAMLLAVLFSFWSFGFARGFNRVEIAKFSEDCLPPLASILLVIGAGGGFSRVLLDCGVGAVLAQMAIEWGLSPLALGWLLAALMRVAVGSATVAITTASGLLAPVAAANPTLSREWLVLAMGAGSLILSHVNDAGFWLNKEYLNLSVPQTLRTWTVIETAISLMTLVVILALSRIM